MISNAVMISAQKKTNLGMGKMLIWGCPGKQTMASGAEDPVFFYFKLNTETKGVGHIVKTSEDGKVEGIKFTITGNGVNETVTTGKNGTVDLDLLPGTYTVTELPDDKYETQAAQTVTIVSGKTSTVTFNNTLRRGDLKVTKTAEDGLVDGVKFHLYGTSYCGLPVDEYAVTNARGVAVFDDVLIGTGYTLEEVGTPDRYIVPDNQTAVIEWNKVTNKSFDNELKRGDLKVTKTAEDGLNEGLKFHLYGTSYSGIPVDEYAVTDASGIATFKDILIGTGYTLEEVDTPIRYVVPNDQTAAIEWNKVTNKSFDNVLMINNGERPKYYVENNHPAIIDSATFGRVQEEMARRCGKRKVKQVGTKTEQGRYSSKYALTELLICGECGTPYRRCTWAANGKKKVVWRCINRLDYGKKYCHYSPSIEESVLQEAIMKAVMQTAKQNAEVLKTLKLHIGMGLSAGTTEDNSLDLQIRIAEIEAEFQKMLKAIVADNVEAFDEEKAKALMDEKAKLQIQLDRIADTKQKRENAKSRLDEIFTIIEALANHPISYDDQIVRQILESVIVESKEKIKVVFVGGLEVTQTI